MLSQGPFSYNRFESYDKLQEKAKPDYLDFDKDGDKKEPMKKALKEKGKKQVAEKKEMPDFIKDKMDKKEGKKECKDCGKEDCGCDKKKEVKEGVTKEDVIAHLIENNYVNNSVSAEAMFNHITDEFLEEIEAVIEEGYKPMPAAKMANQANKAYGKEQSAAKAGDAAGANKQMQRRIAMNNPAGRKAQLGK